MAIRKQEFYEGAALHVLAQGGQITRIRYEAPLFVLNERLSVHLKYSTKPRSPWPFTFTPEEQALLRDRSSKLEIVIGLVCGSDGVAAFSYGDYNTIAPLSASAIHIACYRDHGKHYRITGPDGALNFKVAPVAWRRLLDQ